jgi:hypothetical protein
MSSALSLRKNGLALFSKYKNVTISLILIIIYYILQLINPNWHSMHKPTYNKLLHDDTLKVAAVVQQIKTELSKCESEKDKIKVVTKIVLRVMKQNGC